MHTYEPKAYHNQRKSVPQQIAPHMSKPAVDTESGNHNYKSYKAEKIMQEIKVKHTQPATFQLDSEFRCLNEQYISNIYTK